VGEGTTGAIALNRGEIDAMIYFDTGFGAWDAAGLKYRLLPRPDDVPQVGGFFLQTTPQVLKDQRALAIGMGRATAKSTIFALENPEAATKIFLKLFPEAATPSKSAAENLADNKLIMSKRSPIWKSADPTVTKLGFIRDKEWQDEVEFQGFNGKIPDVKALYTNDLIDEINDFDVEAIKKQAKEYK
jgi:NitT/TauT family transport system substrate-binding protein